MPASPQIELKPAATALRHELEAKRITVIIDQVKKGEYSCHLSPPDNRDSNTTYGQTPEDALQTSSRIAKALWPDLFDA